MRNWRQWAFGPLVPGSGDWEYRDWDETVSPGKNIIRSYGARWEPIVTTSAYSQGLAWMDNMWAFGEFVIVGAGARTEGSNGWARMLTVIYPNNGYLTGDGSYPAGQFDYFMINV